MTSLVLPSWYHAHRPHQLRAVDQVLDAFEAGARVVVLEAPTGAGKTLIAETVRQKLLPVTVPTQFGGTRITRTAYTCSTKSLQDQFARDYPYATVLKGRANYPTELYPDRFGTSFESLSCDDCTKKITKGCAYCESEDTCPYEVAKSAAIRSPLTVLNTSYLLAEANHVGWFSGLDLVIADECDLLDKAVVDFVSVTISARAMKKYEIRAPKKVTVETSWVEWVEEYEPIVKALARDARGRARVNPNKSNVREANYLSNLQRSLGDLRKGLEEGGWVYTGTRDKVEFKPVWAKSVGEEVLWKHGKKWLLMSATVINAESLLSNLGYGDSSGLSNQVTVPSTFPAENRPVIYRPTADMKGRAKDDEELAARDVEWGKLVEGIRRIRSEHPTERILVHTVSYPLTEFLASHFTERVITYTSAVARQAALHEFLAMPGAIMFAPSLDRGIDLPDDACRVQVIAKVPFANLGDKQVSKRLYGGGEEGRVWYTTDAIRTLVQMCGRGVRHKDDKCVTYILDQQFEWKLWGVNRRYFPVYWREALQWKK